MKRLIISVIAVLVQYCIAITILPFDPMHAAPPIRRERAIGVSLGKRQECPFGVVCGGGCTILGPCCDEITGFSCRNAETCITINGQLGCCPVGTTCTSIQSCLNASDPVCVNGAPGDNFFCCDNTVPFCNTLGTAQFCQATELSSSSITNATVTSSAVATQPSTAPKNQIIPSTIAFAVESTILNEPMTATVIRNSTSAATQQLIATDMIQSFHPLNISSTSTKFTASLNADLTRSGVAPATIATADIVVTVTPGASATSVTNSPSSTVTSSTTYFDTLTGLGHTSQLNHTRTTATPIPLFTGGSTQGPGHNGLMIATFGILLGMLL